jgi:uncharacterized membrane protein
MKGSSLNKLFSKISDKEAGAFSYMLFMVSGLFFLLIKKDSSVKFHALQSILVFTTLFILIWILSWVLLWLLPIYKAWQGEEWEVPLFGHYAKKLARK